VLSARALAAAHHQHPQRALPVGEALFRRRDGSDFRAHRVADELLALGEGARETGQRGA
jgi:hypothetical protein